MLGLVQKVITSIQSEQMRRSLDLHSGVHSGIYLRDNSNIALLIYNQFYLRYIYAKNQKH